MAEPDRIDFNTIAHARWGVIERLPGHRLRVHCEVTAGTALVNGTLVNVTGGQSVHVGAGGARTASTSSPSTIRASSSASAAPSRWTRCSPTCPLDNTALAAVLCTAGGGSFSDNVIDKRKFLPDSLLTKIPANNELLVNRNGSGNYFRVTGEGVISWLDDVWLQRDSPGTLRIIRNLKVDDSLTAGGALGAASVTATGKVVGSNIRNGSTLPGTGNVGDLFTDTDDGGVYVYKQGTWKEMATVESAVPMGSIITSLRRPTDMPVGWIPLDGNAQVFEATQKPLFDLLDSWNWPRSGTAPNRVITTRNANKRMLMVDTDAAGSVGGSSTITIGLANLPEHKHGASVTSPGGGHVPSVRVNRVGPHRHSVWGGAHGHNDVPDPGHAHNGADHILGGAIVCAAWGGKNKLDALFNDRSHTYSVEVAEWTRRATTGITYIGSAGSEHGHEVGDAGDHDHTVGADYVPEHQHNINELPVGNSQPLPFTPAYLAVFAYIKA